MLRTHSCPRCSRAFAFNPEQVPVQRGKGKRKRATGPVIAHYPTCPHCRSRVEVVVVETDDAVTSRRR